MGRPLKYKRVFFCDYLYVYVQLSVILVGKSLCVFMSILDYYFEYFATHTK